MWAEENKSAADAIVESLGPTPNKDFKLRDTLKPCLRSIEINCNDLQILINFKKFRIVNPQSGSISFLSCWG